jgi:hypothetical protein
MLNGRFIAEWEALRHSEIGFSAHGRSVRSSAYGRLLAPRRTSLQFKEGLSPSSCRTLLGTPRKGPDKLGPLSFAVETAKELTFQAGGEGCRRRCSSPNL